MYLAKLKALNFRYNASTFVCEAVRLACFSLLPLPLLTSAVSTHNAHSLNTIFWFKKKTVQTNGKKTFERNERKENQRESSQSELPCIWKRLCGVCESMCESVALPGMRRTNIDKWIAFNTNRTSWPIVYLFYNSSAFRCRGGGESCSPYIPAQNEFSRASYCLFGFILVCQRLCCSFCSGTSYVIHSSPLISMSIDASIDLANA